MTDQEKLMWIIVYGDPIGGFFFIGPFWGHEEAAQYAHKTMNGRWWLAEIEKPQN